MRVKDSLIVKAEWISVVIVLIVMSSGLQAQDQLVISETGGGTWISQTIALRVLQDAYQQLNIRIQVIGYPAERVLYSANSGDTDGALLRMAGLEKDYPNLIRVPVPIFYYDLMVFTKELDFQVKGWQSLSPYTINFMRGNKLAEKHTSGMKVETTTTTEQTLRKLAVGRTEVVVGARSVICLVKSLKLKGIRMLEPPLERLPLYHYLHKRHRTLVQRLEVIIKRMEKNKEIKRITDETMQDFIASCD